MTEASFHFPGLSYDTIAAELRRELAHRINLYGKLVTKGNMTEPDAKRQIALTEALIEDCERFKRAATTWIPWTYGARLTDPRDIPRRHGFSWAERRAALLRELAYRARVYPAWIERGRLTAGQAEQRNRCLECLLSLYEDGFDWIPANGVMPHFSEIKPSPEQVASRIEWRAMREEVWARNHPAEQEDLGF